MTFCTSSSLSAKTAKALNNQQSPRIPCDMSDGRGVRKTAHLKRNVITRNSMNYYFFFIFLYLTWDASLLTIWLGRSHWTPSWLLLCKERPVGRNESSTNLSPLVRQNSTMRFHFRRACSSSVWRREADGSLSWREMAAGAGGERAVKLRLDWHISQLYDLGFLLWNVQAEHCHPSFVIAGDAFLVGKDISWLLAMGVPSTSLTTC